MNISIISDILPTFGAGILASLSPCVYPLLPVTLGFFGAQSEKGRAAEVISFTLGQMVIFFFLGLMAVMAGRALGFTSQTPSIQISLGVAFIVFGIFSINGKLNQVLSRKQLPLPKFLTSKQGRIGGAFLFGMGASLLVSPCTTPILSAILTKVSTKEELGAGLVLMLSYSIGFSLLILFLGLGFFNLKKLPRAGKWTHKMHQIGGGLILLAGIYYIYAGISTYIIL